MGLAVIKAEARTIEVLCYDVLRLSHIENHHERLKRIYSAIMDTITEFSPTDASIETPVYGKDPLAMLKLGRAQAASILAIVHNELPLTEYYPKAIKKAITGNGNATKKQVAVMLANQITIPNDKSLPADASDALAVALCHYFNLIRPVTSGIPKKKQHQNRAVGGWESFVSQNPEKVKR